jgi:hypothetical protein
MTARHRGLALPLALLSLVVIAGVVAGGFAIALLEQRAAGNTLYLVQAAAAADAGAAAAVGEWSNYGLEGLLPGDSAALPQVRLPGGSAYQATVQRLNAQLFEVRSIGRRSDASGATLAQREVGLFLRLADSATPGAPTVLPLTNRAWSSTIR